MELLLLHSFNCLHNVYCSVTSREAVFCLRNCLTGGRQLFGRGLRLRATLFCISTSPWMFSTPLSWALQHCLLPTNATRNMHTRLGNLDLCICYLKCSHGLLTRREGKCWLVQLWYWVINAITIMCVSFLHRYRLFNSVLMNWSNFSVSSYLY